MAYFLAIDAGGTKTEFLLANETETLATARTGTIKRLRADEETTGKNLRSGLARLVELSGISMGATRRTCIGTSGETVPLVANWLKESIGSLVGGELLLVGDVEIALDAIFQGGPGVLVLAGTGSNIAGRGSDGAIATAGGWGPALADQGSGILIGLEGLRKGFLAIDEQRESSLLPAVMKHWQLPTLNALIEFANANPAPNFSELAPLVAACAHAGDAVALEVLEKGGHDLAYLAGLVIERVRTKTQGARLPQVAVAGSILQNVAPVRQAMISVLRERYPQIEVIAKAADPVQGALWRARHGWPTESA